MNFYSPECYNLSGYLNEFLRKDSCIQNSWSVLFHWQQNKYQVDSQMPGLEMRELKFVPGFLDITMGEQDFKTLFLWRLS